MKLEEKMAKSKPTILGKFELEIMHVIWDNGKASVREGFTG